MDIFDCMWITGLLALSAGVILVWLARHFKKDMQKPEWNELSEEQKGKERIAINLYLIAGIIVGLAGILMMFAFDPAL